MNKIKAPILLVFTPLILTDILYFILYYAMGELVHTAYESISSSGLSLPAIYSVNDFPHRLILMPVLLFILSAFIICSLLKFDFAKSTFTKTSLTLVKIIVKAKAVFFALGAYLYWYFSIEPKYFVENISSVENPLIGMERLMTSYTLILMALVYVTILWVIVIKRNKQA